jgi:hypothetical protein
MADWDNEIDDAARQMTGGEPDAGFKARVLARIDAETGQRRGGSVWVWPAMALGTAAMLALVMVRSSSRFEGVGTARVKPGITSESKPDTTVRLNPDTAAESKLGRAERAATQSPVASTRHSHGTSASRSYVASARRTESGQVNDAVARASDLAPPPIEIDPIGVKSMEGMESIQVTTLAVARIEVPAIAE